MRGDANRSHAGAAAAVRNRERLVEIEVTHVSADGRRAREADLRVHVRAVHVHLAPVLMDDAADVLDGVLEYAMGRGIRHHQRGQSVAVQLRLGLEVGHVDVPVLIGRHDDNLQPGHHRARRIRSVSRCGDQHDVALRITA